MRAVILGCFFLSGASGLVLEMLWTRMLTLVFGSTTLAVSTVLTAFMGGLGLGSYLAGKWADRLENPARSYAFVEASVGLYALLVPWVISFYPGLNRWLWAAFGDRYALLSILRFVASAGLLILPTTLMGATLPILARHFVRHPWELRRVGLRIGTLYAVNLFGAVAGSFFAGFVFLPSIGLRWTNVTAASFNLTLAAAILLARRFLPRGEPSGTAWTSCWRRRPPKATSTRARARRRLLPDVVMTPAARRVALAGFAVSGAAAMTLQVLVDARARGADRLVDLLVHADPAGVPDRPRARLGDLRTHLAAHRASRSAGWRRCTWASRPRSARRTWSPTSCRTCSPGCSNRRASASTRSWSASSSSPASRCCRRRC